MQYTPNPGETFDDIAARVTISPAYGPAIVRANNFQYTDGTDVASSEDASQFDTIYVPDNWLNAGYQQANAQGGGNVTASFFDSLVQNLPQIVAAFNAQQMAQINIDRAKRGLPAINAAAYGPQIGVNLTGNSQTLVMYAAIGIGVILLLNKRSRA